MDEIASVLFVVTIPTAAEEERLKREFRDKKCDLIISEPDDLAPTTDSTLRLEVDSGKATILQTNALSSNTATTTFKAFNNNYKGNDDEVVNEVAETDVPALASSGNGEKIASIASIPSDIFVKYSQNKVNQEPCPTSCLIEDHTNTTNALAPIRNSWEGVTYTSGSAKSKHLQKKDKYIDEEISQDVCMEFVLKDIFKKFHIQGAAWCKDAEGLMYQIFFTVAFNETYEQILCSFNEWGIGDREGSTVSVMSCITSKSYSQKVHNETENESNTQNNLIQKQSAWEHFMNSVRSRLNVANILRDVRQDAAITFDFVVLLISAAVLASFGLLEDSTIFLASSMLISPLMGPIIAAIFGTVIKDPSLCRLGLKNELLGIFMAVIVGFIFGMAICATDDRYSIGDGLTNEMIARCELHSLIVGVFTAIPSGAAAAVSILGGNIGPLVGVAISASLLPPAVNSGLLWALALICKFFEHDSTRYSSVVKTTIYSNNQATELAILGAISMCLTISNIICIYIMGILVLKVKEIAPVISRSSQEFWKQDIKIARDIKRNGFDTETAIIDEITNLPAEDQRALGINSEFLFNLHKDDTFYQNTWSPVGGRHLFEHTYGSAKENYCTVHHIERLYSTITQQQSMIKKRQKCLGRQPTSRAADKTQNENISRLSIMPSKFVFGERNTRKSDERKGRLFIVTPAEEDPLQPVSEKVKV